jgi:hypothetical protein
MDQPNLSLPLKDEKDRFAEFIEQARSIKEKNVDPRIDHYKTYIAGPRFLFFRRES